MLKETAEIFSNEPDAHSCSDDEWHFDPRSGETGEVALPIEGRDKSAQTEVVDQSGPTTEELAWATYPYAVAAE